MKTVTEFSGTVLREAALIRRAHRPAPPEAKPAEPPAEVLDTAAPAGEPASVADVSATEASPSSDATETDRAAVSADVSGEVGAIEASAGEAAVAGPEADADAAVDDAQAAATESQAGEGMTGEASLSDAAPAELPAEDPGAALAATELEQKLAIGGDRLARLMEALEVLRDRAENVRLVRVLSGEDPPANAKKQGDFYYVVDLQPRHEGRSRDRDERGGRRDGGGDRGRGRGDRSGGGGGGGGFRSGPGGGGGGWLSVGSRRWPGCGGWPARSRSWPGRPHADGRRRLDGDAGSGRRWPRWGSRTAASARQAGARERPPRWRSGR